ncbi:class I SAM-dependent methyltransferase [Nocardioides sp. GCM10027113]|uniref:class I SAM-dependent methyltransferase n=1 Tax=unclassified Nocardioides TaxID=2615069 RepID=UPI00361DC4D8
MDAEAWDERYAASELVWSAGPNRFVERECAGLPPGDALDLAAGEGRNAIWLSRRGWRATAVDFSRVALDKGRTLAEDTPVEWVVGDATTWHRPEGFDLVVVAYLQLRPAQRQAAMRNALVSLRPGGTMLVVAHDSSNISEGTGGPQDPSVLYTAEDVVADLEGAAPGELVVERAERVTRPVEPGHGGEATLTAYDCLVRVRRTPG